VEVVRTLVGSIGLVAAVPITTGLAALVIAGAVVPDDGREALLRHTRLPRARTSSSPACAKRATSSSSGAKTSARRRPPRGTVRHRRAVSQPAETVRVSRPPGAVGVRQPTDSAAINLEGGPHDGERVAVAERHASGRRTRSARSAHGVGLPVTPAIDVIVDDVLGQLGSRCDSGGRPRARAWCACGPGCETWRRRPPSPRTRARAPRPPRPPTAPDRGACHPDPAPSWNRARRCACPRTAVQVLTRFSTSLVNVTFTTSTVGTALAATPAHFGRRPLPGARRVWSVPPPGQQRVALIAAASVAPAPVSRVCQAAHASARFSVIGGL
jgi:hypothetical protein